MGHSDLPPLASVVDSSEDAAGAAAAAADDDDEEEGDFIETVEIDVPWRSTAELNGIDSTRAM